MGQDQGQWWVSAADELLGCAIFVPPEWQRGINKDLNAKKCKHTFNTVRDLYDTGERNTARVFEDQWASPFTDGIVAVNLRASQNGGETFHTSTEPSTGPKLVLLCAQTIINGTEVLF